MRTHTCGELRLEDDKKTVTLCGWIDSIREHGQIAFINLRDRYGITQIVLENAEEAKSLRNEFVLKVEGTVRERPSKNSKNKTGDVEVVSTNLEILNECDVLPIDFSVESSEENRLKYRYLDLRRPENIQKLIFKSQVAQAARDYLTKNNFIEIETPLLVKATPEGARDFVVPSRVNPGKIYSLPQSPQLYKQLLMISGFDRYYQLARCLRDEDLRADRQPEHTQIDLEMSFMNSNQIREMVENLIKHIFKKTIDIKLDKFQVIPYAESMARFGSDKPDLRFGLELTDVTEIANKSDFNVFKAEHVVALTVDEDLSRKQIDKLTNVAKTYKAKGLAFVKLKDGKFYSGVSKFLSDDIQKELIKQIKPKQTVLFVADSKKVAQTALGNVRLALRDQFDLVKADDFKFAFITDFPLFSYNEDEKKWEPEHHMFSMPKEEFVDDFEKRPAETLGDLWDLTLNGIEMASGSIRVSNPDIQKRIMDFVGFPEEKAKEAFGFLLEAYKYGGPVHGGMGIGLDRLTAMMLGINDIREVIAFPKNKAMECPMDGCPSKPEKIQLEELHMKFQ